MGIIIIVIVNIIIIIEIIMQAAPWTHSAPDATPR